MMITEQLGTPENAIRNLSLLKNSNSPKQTYSNHQPKMSSQRIPKHNIIKNHAYNTDMAQHSYDQIMSERKSQSNPFKLQNVYIHRANQKDRSQMYSQHIKSGQQTIEQIPSNLRTKENPYLSQFSQFQIFGDSLMLTTENLNSYRKSQNSEVTDHDIYKATVQKLKNKTQKKLLSNLNSTHRSPKQIP